MTKIYLTGPAGTGKTTYAVKYLHELLTNSIPAHNILVIVPQRTLAEPYYTLLHNIDLPGGVKVEVMTINGLALRAIDLFWPLVAEQAGFGRPQERPVFLSIETAQYYLKQAIAPLLAQGYFDPNVVPITISIPRLMSQILDNLNKIALLGLPHTQVSHRLTASLAIEPNSRVALEHTQECINKFREFCLTRNLLDFSLRIELFYQHLWPMETIYKFLTGRYHHLIVDNIEEDTPFAHTILQKWLPTTKSTLLINDEDAGYRIFLGANWRTAQALQNITDKTISMTESYVSSNDMAEFGQKMSQTVNPSAQKDEPKNKNADFRRAIFFEQKHFYPQIIDWVVNKIAELIQEGVSPNEIVVLAPFVSDALRFSFVERMKKQGLPARSHRPSRPLSEEPEAKTMLTLARLAFPSWLMLPEPFDVAQALHQAISDLDLIRANLLTRVVYRQYERTDGVLTSFEQIKGDVRERITYQAGNNFDRLRMWLQNISAGQPPVLDHFFSRLFDELLTQPGFGFHKQQENGEVVARLIDSARNFRRVAERVPLEITSNKVKYPTVDRVNMAYIDMIEQGIMAAQYMSSWQPASEEAVLITPATTFLMSNRPVDYQFWLDAGSNGWWERISQPLTHPYIMAADWEQGRPWTDEDEVSSQRDWLYRLTLGLSRRCRHKLFIVNSEIGEQGYEQRGQLLMALQQMIRQKQRADKK